MSECSFKIALRHLESVKTFSQKKEAIFNMLKDIKNGKIKNKKDFVIILKESEISERDLIQVIQKEISEGKSILDFILYLGEGNGGLNLIPDSWFARNLSDRDVIKRIPPKYWELVRKPEWVKQHNI